MLCFCLNHGNSHYKKLIKIGNNGSVTNFIFSMLPTNYFIIDCMESYSESILIVTEEIPFNINWEYAFKTFPILKQFIFLICFDMKQNYNKRFGG